MHRVHPVWQHDKDRHACGEEQWVLRGVLRMPPRFCRPRRSHRWRISIEIAPVPRGTVSPATVARLVRDMIVLQAQQIPFPFQVAPVYDRKQKTSACQCRRAASLVFDTQLNLGARVLATKSHGATRQRKGPQTTTATSRTTRELYFDLAPHNTLFLNMANIKLNIPNVVPWAKQLAQLNTSMLFDQLFPIPVTGTPSPCTEMGMQRSRHRGTSSTGLLSKRG